MQYVDLGTKLTDERMYLLEKRLNANYSAALRTALKREKVAIEKLAAFDATAHPELTAQQLADARYSYMLQVNRATGIVNNIASDIAKAGETSAKMIQQEMLNVYGLNLDWSRYSIDRETGLLLDWTIYDKRQLQILLDKNASPFTKIAYRNMGADRQIVMRLQNQLAQATMLGESQPQIIKRIQEVTGQSYRQAKRVAQTERNRVASQGRFQGIEEAADMQIEMQKRWISRLDDRVRPAHKGEQGDHVSISGMIVDYDEPFINNAGSELMYPGDNNAPAYDVIACRCVLQPIVKNVPNSIKQYRERMNQNWGFEKWQESRGVE